MGAVSEEKDTYRVGFERFALSKAAASEPSWLRERRTAAFAGFVESGLPTPRDEAWRHTPIAPLVRARAGTGRSRGPARSLACSSGWRAPKGPG